MVSILFSKREKPFIPSKMIILLILSVSSFLNPFISTSVNTALPSIGKTFGVGEVTQMWVVNAFLFTSSVLLLSFGKWADRVGPYRLFIPGLFLFGLGNAGSALGLSVGFMIASRAVQGLGSAMLYASVFPILTKTFPKEKRGLILGVNLAIVSIGLTVGPFLGGIITDAMGWHWMFWVVSALSFVLWVFAFVLFRDLKEPAQVHPHPFDIKGAVIYTLGMGGFIGGLTELTTPWGFLFPVGVILLVVFYHIEKKTDEPMLDTSLLTENKLFLLSNLSCWYIYAASFICIVVLSLYAQNFLGYSASEAGLLLMVQAVMMSITTPLSGRLSDKYNQSLVTLFGQIIYAIGSLLLFLCVYLEWAPYWLYISMTVCGIGYGSLLTPLSNTIMSSVGKHQLGTASATLSSMRQIGQSSGLSLGMVVTAFLSAKFFGTRFVGEVPVELKKAFAQSHSEVIFFIVFVLSVLAVINGYLTCKHSIKKTDNSNPSLSNDRLI